MAEVIWPGYPELQSLREMMVTFAFLRSVGCEPPQLVVPHPEMIDQSPGFSALVGQHAGKTWLSEGLEKSTADESLNKVKS